MLKFSFKRSRRSTDSRWFTKAARASAFAACLLTAFPPARGFASEPAAAAATNPSSSIVSLVKALSSEDADARKEAAQELTWMGPQARPALPALEACLRDQNPIVRATAARAVWEIGGETHAAVPVLVELLESRDKNHRKLAAYYLGPMAADASAAIPALHEALTDNDVGLRIHAAEALTQIQPKATVAVDVLIEATKSQDAEVRSLAAMAFQNVDPLHSGKVVPALMAALIDADPSVRTSAELALPNFNLDVAHSGADSLADASAANTTPFAEPGAEVAEPSKLTSALEQAVRDLSHDDPAIRRNALERIAWMGTDAEAAAVDVTLCLADPQLEIRAYAAKTLWDVDKQSSLAAVNTLKDLVDSTQPGIRSLASFYLGYIGPQASSALPVLKRALANTESTEQLQIAEAIARIRPEDSDAVNVLLGGLGDSESGIRFQAAYALGEVSPVHASRVVPLLASATADQSPEVRRAAEFALTNFPKPAAPPVQVASRVPQQPIGKSRVMLLDPEPVAARAAFAEIAGETVIAAEGVAHAEEPKDNRLGLGDDYKPISSLTVSISPKRRSDEGQLLDLPTNYGAAWLETQGIHYQPAGESRPWTVQPIQYAASGFCHKPLYFEEINLERYGHNFGCVMQPFVSAAAFYGRVPLMPYMMAADCPCDCQYTLGHFRPGSCAPYYVHHLPWSTSGTLLEAGIITALFFAIY